MSWLGITHAGPDDDNNPNDAANWPQPAPSAAPWGWSVDPEDPTKVVITDAQYEPVIYGECLNPCDLPLLTASPLLLAACEALVAFETHNHPCLMARMNRECAECNTLALAASDLLRPAIAQARGEVPS